MARLLNMIPIVFMSLIFSIESTHADPSWPQWRGPERDGIVDSVPLPETLTETENKVVWSTPLAPSYSGPVIAEGKVFTTETVDEKDEVVRAFDKKTGKELWKTSWPGAMSVFFIARANGDWIRATPAYADGKLYVAGMQDLVVCLDTQDGSILWKADLANEFKTGNPPFGFVSSPLVDGDALYVQAANSVCRLNAQTGKVEWRVLKSSEAFGSAFSSPIIATIHGQRQLVVQTRKELAGLNLADGSPYWQTEVPAFRDMNILTPTILGNKIFTSTYGGSSLMYEIQKQDDGTFSVAELWTNKAQGYMSSPVVINGDIYLHLRNQRFTCINSKTGETKWTTTPFGKYWSLLTDGKRILALDERGDLLLINVNPNEFELISQLHISDSPSWAHLAIDDVHIYVRTLDELLVYSHK